MPTPARPQLLIVLLPEPLGAFSFKPPQFSLLPSGLHHHGPEAVPTSVWTQLIEFHGILMINTDLAENMSYGATKSFNGK